MAINQLLTKFNEMKSNEKVEALTTLVQELKGTETVLFINSLKEVFNITDDMLTVSSSGNNSNGAVVETVASTTCKLKGTKVDETKKLGIIKFLKELLGLNLQEINGMVSKIASGESIDLIKDKSKDEADTIIKKAAEIGLTVEIC
jgi:ribosomal protein L7/L12